MTARPLFRELLEAPDRDHAPGCRPVVSFHPAEDPADLQALEALALTQVHLERRGVDHGWIAELPESAAPALPALPLAAWLDQRWYTGRPLVFPAHAPPLDAAARAARLEQFESLQQPPGLRHWLETALADDSEFQLARSQPPLADPERDLERVALDWRPAGGSGLHASGGLWLKSGRLSAHPADRSLRVRLSFGDEGRDDASRDLARQRALVGLAERLFPESRSLVQRPSIGPALERWLEGAVLGTQAIAYWNAPQGGALFHHDAFDEPLEGGQRGVLFTQFIGRTAWLAVSIEDLARRVIEFVEYLAEGELAWVRASLFPQPEPFEQLQRWCGRFGRLLDELAKPGCGKLGRIVNQGPEFSALLADAGHAYILDEGDALLLPNHGYRCTAMHSVFCASDGPTFALSVALREADPSPRAAPAAGPPRTHPGPGRRRRRRRRRR